MPPIVIAALFLSIGEICLAEDVSSFAQPEEQAVNATLIAEHASIQPGGATRIGVLFELEEGWHIYARDPGDAGLPTTVVWSGATGVSFGPLQWPTARALTDPGDIRTFGYTGSVLLFSTMTAPLAGTQPFSIRAKVTWLACNDLCVPGSAELALLLPLTDREPLPSSHAELFPHPSDQLQPAS